MRTSHHRVPVCNVCYKAITICVVSGCSFRCRVVKERLNVCFYWGRTVGGTVRGELLPRGERRGVPPQKRGGVVREEDERVNHGAVCEGHILVVLWKFGIDPISPCCWRGGRRVLVREEEQRPQRQDSSTCRVQSALRRKKKGRTGGLVWKGHRGP